MELRSGAIRLVAFTPAMTRKLFEFRNHPSVREGMSDTTPLTWESHQEWVRNNLLNNPHYLLFIVHARDKPVGIALLRDITDTSAEIGILIQNPEQNTRAAYRASQILGQYAFHWLGVQTLYSNVPRHNERALAFNIHCGFSACREPDETYHYLSLSLEHSLEHDLHPRLLSRFGIEVIGD